MESKKGLTKAEKLLIELDNEEIKKYGRRLERNFKIGDTATLRDSRIYTIDIDSQIELRRLADTKEEVTIKSVNYKKDGNVFSYDIVTKTGVCFYGFGPSEFDPAQNVVTG